MFAEAHGYHARSFLTNLLNKGGSTTLSEFGGSTPSTAIAYDALGDVASVKANVPAAPSSYSGTTSYQYDGKTELTQEASTRSGGYTNANSYDLAENPTQVRGVTQPTANADNQIPVSGVTYDGNGNPSKVEGLTASFDILNRAMALGSVSNTWGANGLRASKGSTYFLYDGNLPVCELSSTGAVTATNTFGGAGLISRHTSGGSTFYTFDAQGNVAQRYTSTGSLVSSDLYDAFGKGTSTGSGDVFAYEGQFGYYTDITTGMILCGHRFYDSMAGRFINRDPIGYNGGINLYGYTGNNASNAVDPSGLNPATGALRSGELVNNSSQPIPTVFDGTPDGKHRIECIMTIPPGYQSVPSKVDIDDVKLKDGDWEHIKGRVYGINTAYATDTPGGYSVDVGLGFLGHDPPLAPDNTGWPQYFGNDPKVTIGFGQALTDGFIEPIPAPAPEPVSPNSGNPYYTPSGVYN